MTARVVFGLAIVAAIAFVSGCKSPGTGAQLAEAYTSTNSTDVGAKSTLHTPVLNAQLQAEIYEVQATDSGLSLDSKELAKRASTSQRLLKELQTFGKTRVLYRFDQKVNVLSETLSNRSSEPVITGTRKDSRGEPINSITYQQVGAILKLAGRYPSAESRRKTPEVTLKVELAALADSGVEIAAGQKVPSIRAFTLEHTDQFRIGDPVVLLTTSSASGHPLVYVVRYVFGK